MFIRFCCYFQRFGVRRSFFFVFSVWCCWFSIGFEGIAVLCFFYFLVCINALLLVLLLLPLSARKRKKRKTRKEKEAMKTTYISLFVLFQFPFPIYTESPTPALHFPIEPNGRSHSTLKSGGTTRRPIRHFHSMLAACCGPLGFRV